MNFYEQHREAMFEHYLALCRIPGWKPYAWAQVLEMARTNPLHADLPTRIRAAMTEQGDAES